MSGAAPREDALSAVRAAAVGLEGVLGPVVVACSGGPDSLTVLALACDQGLDPIAVHVDHGLRPDSASEAEVVGAAAESLGARVDRRRVEVAAGPNLEARARDARYAALTDAAREHGATAILVGHTADDQAETVLLALLRGSGSAGLAGMAVRRGLIVRPLLRVRRAETEACCAALGFTPVRDPMNDDRSFRRSWIRHEVLPLLEAGAARDLVPVLTRQADLLREESEYLDALARAAWPPDPSGALAPSDALARLPRPLARRAVRAWLGAPPPSADEVERVLAVARGDAVATELAGGRRVWRTRGQMAVQARGERGSSSSTAAGKDRERAR